MDAFEFIAQYENFIQEIENIIKPELLPMLEDIKKIDPHDLISPETLFVSTNHARGFVWSLFLKNVRKIQGKIFTYTKSKFFNQKKYK